MLEMVNNRIVYLGDFRLIICNRK
uniref:Uncharacterized protein n=1 Tax=Rhizophora mucronata TaxID=61149 RepID=A0A2P2P6D3_RHIMU